MRHEFVLKSKLFTPKRIEKNMPIRETLIFSAFMIQGCTKCSI